MAGLKRGHPRRMGLRVLKLRKIAKDLQAQGVLVEDDPAIAAEQIAAVLVAENCAEVNACFAEDGRDWESFFQALAAFIEVIMPLILMFL